MARWHRKSWVPRASTARPTRITCKCRALLPLTVISKSPNPAYARLLPQSPPQEMTQPRSTSWQQVRRGAWPLACTLIRSFRYLCGVCVMRLVQLHSRMQPAQRGLARKRSSLAVSRYCSCSGANICAVQPVMNGLVNVIYAPSFRDIQPVHNWCVCDWPIPSL
jgi:hypothetical protein